MHSVTPLCAVRSQGLPEVGLIGAAMSGCEVCSCMQPSPTTICVPPGHADASVDHQQTSCTCGITVADEVTYTLALDLPKNHSSLVPIRSANQESSRAPSNPVCHHLLPGWDMLFI